MVPFQHLITVLHFYIDFNMKKPSTAIKNNRVEAWYFIMIISFVKRCSNNNLKVLKKSFSLNEVQNFYFEGVLVFQHGKWTMSVSF